MYNRGMIDDVIVVGTGLLLALLLCGGLVTFDRQSKGIQTATYSFGNSCALCTLCCESICCNEWNS